MLCDTPDAPPLVVLVPMITALIGRWTYRLWKATLIATAFAPALGVYGVVLLTECEYLLSFLFIGTGVVLWALCHLFLRWSVRRASRLELKPTSVEVADSETLGFLLVYLLPLITRDLTEYNWIAWVIVASVFVLVVAAGYTYHFNPLLVLTGWHFYKINTTEEVRYVLITRDRILEANKPRKVGRLTEYIFLDKGGMADT